jgi:chromosome segregation and condensation protein ScpB
LEHGLRLITTDATPALELARTLEALLVVASQPLAVDELAAAAEADPSQVEESLSIHEQRV